ncbi:hypothetical protein THF1C08_320073 [Vibrio jasicida]|uniref:Uncharacterized protein n=1 Tax=Vibrio jasicida TaxID=766224 RepID=A0AAU9QSN5_9VIBR|nr:hypothetical protein THF1C08_320073 [Vibrio jasicida]CAH1597485.1 hypothetical protein THF1A12_320073 [Vibrio jasicida]
MNTITAKVVTWLMIPTKNNARLGAKAMRIIGKWCLYKGVPLGCQYLASILSIMDFFLSRKTAVE